MVLPTSFVHFILSVLCMYCYDYCTGFCPLESQGRKLKYRTSLSMVRNIDLPEALIFYGWSTVVDATTGELRNGLKDILKECAEIETVAVLLMDQYDHAVADIHPATSMDRIHTSWIVKLLQQVHAPNPSDLLDIVHSITVQPRPFGGSSGFGSKPADPERNLLPQRCVVFTTTVAQTRAARAAGMRVISIDNSLKGSSEDVLADAVIGSFEDINGLDDIATPGSYWLNPPHPRDDYGNSIDPEWFAAFASEETVNAPFGTVADDMDDEGLKAILADIAPLQ